MISKTELGIKMTLKSIGTFGTKACMLITWYCFIFLGGTIWEWFEDDNRTVNQAYHTAKWKWFS